MNLINLFSYLDFILCNVLFLKLDEDECKTKV